MKNLSKATHLADRIREKLVGHSSKTFKGIVTDVFVSPPLWHLAEAVFKERKVYGIDFPLKEWNELTLIASFTDHHLEEVKSIVIRDKREDLLSLVQGLPNMYDHKPAYIH